MSGFEVIASQAFSLDSQIRDGIKSLGIFDILYLYKIGGAGVPGVLLEKFKYKIGFW